MIKKSISRSAVLLTAALMAAAIPSKLQATPYASCIADNAGTIQFHLNENGGTVVVTYEDNSINPNFNGTTTGTNLGAGLYSFSLTGHTTYSIAVSSLGTGKTHMVDNSTLNGLANPGGTTNSMFIVGNLRGLDVNRNPTSPYFGRVYFDRSNPGLIYALNSDASFVISNSAGVAWPANTFGPYRMSIAADDYLSVGSAESSTAGIWRIAPDLSGNQLLLGPVGDANGQAANMHGLIFSRPLLDGNLQSGGSANLYQVDNDYPPNNAQVNSDLIYSNITLATLPWQTTSPYVGPQIGLNIQNLQNVLPSISKSPNGYFYFSEQRGNSAIPNLYVFDSSANNLLWDSLIQTNVSDYFEVLGNGLVDFGISPDFKYLVGITGCGCILMCSITNGIPDVSTLVTNQLPALTGTGSSASARGICWDAADNFYTASTADAFVRQWSLGQSVKATTTGNAGGTTGFSQILLIPTLNVYATNNTVISQANSYGNPTSGSFTIVRTGGNTGLPLTVNFTYSGTAPNGTYTAGSTGTLVMAAGQTTTNISITAVTDGIARLTTALTLTVAASPANYILVGSGTATMSILNTAPDKLTATVKAPSMYNAFSNDYASVTITRIGDSNAASYVVNNFTVAGTAVEGTDYTVPSAVTFNPGDLTQTTYIYPLIGGSLPVHSSSLPFTGNKTIIVGIGTGGSYTPATNTAALTIIDSATPPAPVLFADMLTDPNDAVNWTTNSANDNLSSQPLDVDVEFGSDLTATPTYAIPFPPNGSQYALKMTVNKNSGTAGTAAATAVNVYLNNHVFSGNYAVRFNMNVIEGDTTLSAMQTGFYDPEEGPLMGINHNGLETNLWFTSFAVGETQTNFTSDGVWYWISDTGGRFDDVGQYYEKTGLAGHLPNTGWTNLANQFSANFANAFKTNVFTCYASANVPPYNSGWTEGGPGLPVNGTATLGFSVNSWSDVEIKQFNGVVTLSIDKTPIFVYTNKTTFTSGQLMMGYEDPDDGGETADTAVYYSNLRVVAIGAPVITNIGMDNVHGTVVMDFSVTDDGGSFSVQGASKVTGPYATVAATITPLGSGAFQAVVPQNGAIQFYRILQQ